MASLEEQAKASGIECTYPYYKIIIIDGKKYIVGYTHDEETEGCSESAPLKEVV